jgi:4-deoxy-L-threo-5-hexosulose-uronate ketol-isomerase
VELDEEYMGMEVRNAANPRDVKSYDSTRLREEFLIQGLFAKGETRMVYSHDDRIIAGSICPISPITLEAGEEIRAEYFLQRREMGIINIGSRGSVIVDGAKYEMNMRDGLYVGMGAKEVEFASDDQSSPARFYFNSAPAHASYPTTRAEIDEVEHEKLGTLEGSNQRTIYRYIHPHGIPSCQLVMGMTILEPGSVWNTMPCHTHDRRMEVYLYFNLPEDGVVFHYMGEPSETRHIIIRNEEAVISPSWSIHSGCGTKNYAFIWGMVGENQVFADQDFVAMRDLR